MHVDDVRKMQAAKEAKMRDGYNDHSNKKYPHDKEEGRLDRAAEVENQKREDQEHQFGNYLSGQRRIGRDASDSALKLNAAFQSGKYDSE